MTPRYTSTALLSCSIETRSSTACSVGISPGPYSTTSNPLSRRYFASLAAHWRNGTAGAP